MKNRKQVMKHLIGKKVSAVADCGTYKGKCVKGIISFYETTGQYLVKTDTHTVSVKEETIELLN